jgi:hypothetical protein
VLENEYEQHGGGIQIDNPEKLVTLGTQDKQNKKHTTMRKNESNVNKTLALLHKYSK